MRKKYLLMLITAALVAAVALGGSLAAVSASGHQATNQLAAPTLEIGITDASYTVESGVLVPGDQLDERATTFQVNNTAEVAEYTRVTIRKYWVDENGEKNYDLDTSLLTMDVTGNGWLTAEGGISFTSGETDVFYYIRPIASGESVTLPLSIQVSGAADNAYQKAGIQLEVSVDSVQYVAGENELNRQGIENTFGVLATLNGDGSIQSLAQ